MGGSHQAVPEGIQRSGSTTRLPSLQRPVWCTHGHMRYGWRSCAGGGWLTTPWRTGTSDRVARDCLRAASTSIMRACLLYLLYLSPRHGLFGFAKTSSAIGVSLCARTCSTPLAPDRPCVSGASPTLRPTSLCPSADWLVCMVRPFTTPPPSRGLETCEEADWPRTGTAPIRKSSSWTRELF